MGGDFVLLSIISSLPTSVVLLLQLTLHWQIAVLAQMHLLVPAFWYQYSMDLAKKRKTELK